jgi:hypothetical protein
MQSEVAEGTAVTWQTKHEHSSGLHSGDFELEDYLVISVSVQSCPLRFVRLSVAICCRTIGLRLPIRHSRHLDWPTRTIRESRSQDLHPVLRHKQSMLELSRPTAVDRDTRPVVRPGLVLVTTQRDHWLDGEAHSWFRLADSLVLPIMWHIRRAVKQLIDSVTTVCFHDAAVASLCHLLDHITVVSEQRTRFHKLDGLVETCSGSLDDAHIVRVLGSCFANVVGLVQVAVKAAVIQSDVDVNDVTFLECALIRYAVTYDFVG